MCDERRARKPKRNGKNEGKNDGLDEIVGHFVWGLTIQCAFLEDGRALIGTPNAEIADLRVPLLCACSHDDWKNCSGVPRSYSHPQLSSRARTRMPSLSSLFTFLVVDIVAIDTIINDGKNEGRVTSRVSQIGVTLS
jgi:hypothetical protein